MSLNLAWDPLFRLPLATGVLLAAVLPLLGSGLRLREQWFSSLGVAQMAAAGGVAGALLHAPVLLFAVLGALFGGVSRALTGETRNEHYAVMLLAGWAAVMLIGMYSHHAQVIAVQLLNGQLYFSSVPHFVGSLLLLATVLLAGRWLMPRLLTTRLFPGHFRANRQPSWPHELCFEVLLVAGVVLGISTMGIMATFAMMFVPPWVAFRLARSWKVALRLSALIGAASCLLGFVAALALDLPFGPTLVAVLLLSVPLRLLPARLGESRG